MSRYGPMQRSILLFILPTVGVLLSLMSLSACTQPEAAAATTYDSQAAVMAIIEAEPNVPTDSRRPWLGQEAWQEGLSTGQQHMTANPQPLNVQALQGLATAEIWVYMQEHVSGALGVGCQYCHSIDDYAADTHLEKVNARWMMFLVKELNEQFVTQTPAWTGNYVQCATCHRGQARNMLAYSAQNEYLVEDPDAGLTLQTWVIDTYAIDPDNDYVFRHANTGTMLAMVHWMEDNWAQYALPRKEPIEPQQQNRQYYRQYNDIYYSVPNCYTCHVGNRIPPAAIHRSVVEEGGNVILPPLLRGTPAITETQQTGFYHQE